MQGCSSVVNICESVKNPKERFAVKIMRVYDEEYYNIAMKEFKLIEGLGKGHPNIIKVIDIFYNTMRKKMHILMEFAGDGCDLKKLIA